MASKTMCKYGGFKPPKKNVKRKCLKCQQQFLSYGPGNRLCNDCKVRNGYESGIRECRVIKER